MSKAKNIILQHAKAEQALPLLSPNSVQAVIADPPYFEVVGDSWDNQWKTEEDYLDWTTKWVKASMRVLKEDGLMFIFGQPGKRRQTFLHIMSGLISKGFLFHDLLVWDRVVGYNDRKDSFTPQYEMILVLRKGDKPVFYKEDTRVPYDKSTIALYMKDKRYKDPEARKVHLEKGKFSTNILRIPSLKGASNEKVGHPTQKPEKLISLLIKSSTRACDTVLDPFVGSGTTVLEAVRLGRKCIGMDDNSGYIEMARKRLKSNGW